MKWPTVRFTADKARNSWAGVVNLLTKVAIVDEAPRVMSVLVPDGRVTLIWPSGLGRESACAMREIVDFQLRAIEACASRADHAQES